MRGSLKKEKPLGTQNLVGKGDGSLFQFLVWHREKKIIKLKIF